MKTTLFKNLKFLPSLFFPKKVLDILFDDILGRKDFLDYKSHRLA